MTYGVNPQLFTVDGPAILAARALQARSTGRALALASRARPATDDSPDGYPLAL